MSPQNRPNLDDYVDVAERIRLFREQYPEGSLCPLMEMEPYTIETIGEQTYVVVVAAAYRHPEDPRPGVGMAWEPFPGPTSFTKDSELQNAETSAWGRAIVAALAADTKRIASAEEVRNRSGNDGQPKMHPRLTKVMEVQRRKNRDDSDVAQALAKITGNQRAGYSDGPGVLDLDDDQFEGLLSELEGTG